MAAAANGASDSTAENPLSAPPSTAQETPLTLSIEEFASSEEQREQQHRVVGHPPPTSIQIPSDQHSCASSITTHFQNADLFVSSMYPSIQGITHQDDDEIHTTQCEIAQLPPTPTAEESLFNLERKAVGKAATRSKRNTMEPDCCSTTQSQSSPITQQQQRQQVNLNKKNAREDQIKEAPMDNKPFRSPQSTNLDNNNPYPGGASQMDCASTTTATTATTMTMPGAYRISPPRRWQPSATERIEWETPTSITSSSDQNIPTNSGLVEAQPVVLLDLPVAEEQQGEATMRKQEATNSIAAKKLLGRKWCLLLLLGAMIVAAWCFAIFGSAMWKMNPKQRAKELKIRETIQKAFGVDYFDSEPKEKALHWIVHQDPLQDLSTKESGEVNEANLIQRYSLVAFYFQTSFENPWSYCNPPQGQQSGTCYFMPFKERNSDQVGVRWLSPAHECQWMGVDCLKPSKTVTKLRIWNVNATGHLPSELSKLSSIKTLSLGQNRLSGFPPGLINCPPLVSSTWVKISSPEVYQQATSQHHQA